MQYLTAINLYSLALFSCFSMVAVNANSADTTQIKLAVIIKPNQQCNFQYQTIHGSYLKAMNGISLCNPQKSSLEKSIENINVQRLKDEFNRLRVIQTTE